MTETSAPSPERATTTDRNLYAVAVEHLPENCPLEQLTPDDALKLADNLKKNPSTGVFSMKLHHGIVLVETDNPDELVDLFSNVLPKHEPAEVADVSDHDLLREVHAGPAKLDEEDVRHAVLAAAHEKFPHKGFDGTEANSLPSLPLASAEGMSLPDYLEQHAPQPTDTSEAA